MEIKFKEPKKRVNFYLIFVLFIVASHFLLVPLLPKLRFLLDVMLKIFFLVSSVIGIFIMLYLFFVEFSKRKRIIASLLIIGMVACSMFFLTATIPYLPDVANWITSDYAYVEGTPCNIKISHGRGGYQRFTINAVTFEISPDTTFKEVTREKYKVTYLPHSKYVLNIEKVDEE